MSSFGGHLRRHRLCVVALVLGIAGAPVLGAVAAWADAPDRHGYWRQDGIGALGSPPVDVADGGLLVSRGLAAEAAISALALELDGRQLDALVLRVDGRDASGAGGVVACRAISTWVPPDGAGAWNDRPEHDCSTAIAPDIDGDQWTFAVGPLVRGGRLDVVLVPAEGVEPFSVAFAAPDAATVRLRPGRPSNDSPAPTTSAPAPAGSPSVPDSASGSSGFDTSFPDNGASGFEVPSGPAPSSAEDVPAEDVSSPPVGPEGPDDAGSSAGVDAAAPIADRLAERPDAASLALVGVTGLGAVAVWLWRRARAAGELAVDHPLAGLPALAGDSVRDAGRALVDDEASAGASPSAEAPEEVLA